MYMEAVEDARYLDPAKRADIEEYTFFCADYQAILEIKY